MIETIPPPRDRAEELYDLTGKVFGNYYQWMHFARDSYFGNSSYDWDVSRVAVADGGLVAHAGVWDYTVRVGRARLRLGAVGAVTTHGDYRKRGFMARIFADLVPAMRDAGYDLTLLFGISDFYHRFGYVQAWPNTIVTADLADLPGEKLSLTMRKVPLAEAVAGRGAVMRIYNRDNATRTGTAVRPNYTRPGRYWLTGDCRTLSDKRGAVRGYIVTDVRDGKLEIREVGGLGKGCGVGQILAAVKAVARRAGCKQVATRDISYAHPLCAALRRGSCRVELSYNRSGGPMIQALNLRVCLAKMEPEMTARLAASRVNAFRGVLLVESGGDKVGLKIAAGKVSVVDRPARPAGRVRAGAEIARMLLGSEPPSVLAAQGDVRFTGAAAELAEALFPAQWPMMGILDHV